MSSCKTCVTVTVEGGQGELEIIDGNFRVVERGFGTLQNELKPGIYKARARAGNERREELFIVEPGEAAFKVTIGPLYFSSPIPLYATSTTQESHEQALLTTLTSPPLDVELGQGATLLLSIRNPSNLRLHQEHSSTSAESYLHSFKGFYLHNTDGVLLLNFDEVMQAAPDYGAAIIHLHMRPGNYVLSYERDVHKQIAMPLPSLPNWKTQIFIDTELPEGHDGFGLPNLADRAVMVTPNDFTFNPEDRYFRLAEIARHALMQGRCALSHEEVEKMLEEKSHNPVLGLFAAHLLLLERQPPQGLLYDVIDYVANFVGQDFPDVVALRIALGEISKIPPKLAPSLPFPPLLRSSYDIVARYPELLQVGSFMCKVASRLVSQGPWFAWEPAISTKKDLALIRSSAQFLVQNKQTLSLQALDKLPGLMKAFNVSLSSEDTPQSLQAPSVSIDTEPSVVEKPFSTPDNASVALKAIITLAQQVPWDDLFNRLQSEAAHRDLLAQLTTLQKSLLPTLKLIYLQLQRGEEFTLDKLEELCKGLNVPLSVLRKSLEDLVRMILRWDMAMLLKKFTEK